jgi:hypothetical protein
MTTTRPKPTPTHGLTFNAGNHQYRLDGATVPSVTGILGCLDKPAIPKWAAETVARYVTENSDAIETLRTLGETGMIAALKEIPWKKRDDAGARGTTLHAYAEALLNGEEVDVDDDLVPVVENALRFMDDWQIEPLITEAAVASRTHQYAGTLDLIARYKRPDTGHEGIGILDWKSAKTIYPETSMQLAAYAYAEFYGLAGDEHPLPKCDAAFGVHIRPDAYDVHPMEFGDNVFAEFLVIRETFGIVKRMRGDWKSPGSGYVGIAVRSAS